LSGEELASPPPSSRDNRDAHGQSGRGDVSFVYDPTDDARFERYARMISDGGATVVSFPLHSAAAAFWDFLGRSGALPLGVERQALLYPRSGAKAEWRAWLRLASEDGIRVVVGAQSSAMAPLRNVSRIIVEDESNNIWRTMRPPIYNVRSLLAKRALLEGASLVLGGRMPSSRAYMRMESEDFRGVRADAARRNVILVDMKLAYSPSVKGVCDALAVSEPLVRETDSALGRGSWAIWILDRKGYAGEIICSECGISIRCGICGGTMRWEASAGRTSCVACGARGTVPEVCPGCSGMLLSAKRPGLEALISLARSAMTVPVPVISLEDEDIGRSPALDSHSGLAIGTRGALSLCDSMNVGMIGWIDADGEARSQEYDARTRAYGLVWESLWRGRSPENRTVLLQTRRPGAEWQRGLGDSRPDWRRFWREEMRERREFTMPPFASLVKIEASLQDVRTMAGLFESGGFEFWMPDEAGAKRPSIWLRTRRISDLRRTIEPFFHISRAKRGYPSVTVWHE
ncbi:MAG: hypothetical protein LBQ56_07950, partial [Synergistaceae bacterium]|nr:hypothetical protein [Synergistaceae bacterium]